MAALGSLLVQNQIVGVKQIEQALQHQVIHGGSLETNVLELGLVGEEVLAEYAARSRGMPVLLRELLNVPNQRAIKMLPWSAVEKSRILPIRLEDTRMIIAADEEPHSEDLEEIAFAINVRFDAYYVHEFRLAMGLNRHYGLPMSPRMVALQRRYEPDFEVDQPPTVRPPSSVPGLFSARPAGNEASSGSEVGTGRIVTIGPPSDPEKITTPSSEAAREPHAAAEVLTPGQKSGSAFENRERIRRTAELYREKVRRQRSSASPMDGEVHDRPEPGDASAHDLVGHSEGEPAVLVSLAEARERLDDAKSRDEILDVVMDFARQSFEFLVLLVVHGKMAQGRTAVWGRRETQRIDHLAIPLDQGGMFETAFETKSLYLGPPGTAEADQDALKRMGRAGLRNCAILPIFIRHRVIMLLYGDGGQSGVLAEEVSSLSRFCRYVSEAFERLLISRKQSSAPVESGRGEPGKKREPLSFVAKLEAQISESAARESKTNGHKEKNSSSAGRYHVKGDEVAEKDRSSLVDELGPRRKSRKPAAQRRPSIVDLERSGHIGPPGFRDPVGGDEDLRRTRDFAEFSKGASQDEPLDLASEVSAEPEGEARLVTRQRGLAAQQGKAPSKAPVKAAAVVNVGGGPPKGRSVIVEMREEIERLIERILSPGSFDEAAAELLMGIGDDALAGLVPHFPGPLKYDRYQLGAKLPRVSFHGPLLKLLVRLGPRVTPHVQPLLESLDSDVRFYATFLFSEITAPELLPALTKRLFDPDRQVRALAADVIRQYARFPEFRWAVRNLVRVLDATESKVEEKRLAAFALGELKVAEALRPLARMLGSADQGLVQAAHKALVKISFNDFGFSERRWLAWLDANNDRHRLEWAIASLEHPADRIRFAATAELRKTVGVEVEWPDQPTDARQMLSAKKQCESWWRKEGAAFHLIEGNE